jgi:hypothetical protein
MTPAEEKRWLEENIPHRIRVMLASTTELSSLRPNGGSSFSDPVVKRCWTDAAWEGRLVLQAPLRRRRNLGRRRCNADTCGTAN